MRLNIRDLACKTEYFKVLFGPDFVNCFIYNQLPGILRTCFILPLVTIFLKLIIAKVLSSTPSHGKPTCLDVQT